MKTKMEDEIYSQKDILNKIEKKYIKTGEVDFGFKTDFEEIKFIASGSSYNAARLAVKFFEIYTDKRASFEYASEFISNTHKVIKKDTLYCFVSQSGETYDTKCALEIVKQEFGKTLGVVNNSNSTIYNNTDFKIDMTAGIEYSIAATKSFLSGVICLLLFALQYSKTANSTKILNALNEAKTAINDVLQGAFDIEPAAILLSKKQKVSIIGYNAGYLIAKEGALKIKETSFIDTSSYPTGEFLHGHTAVLNKSRTLIEIYTSEMSEFEKNTLKKIKNDFEPEIIAITDVKDDELQKGAVIIPFKKYNSNIAKICAITIIIQLLALKTAILTGADVDKPHGLNKVVSG